MDVLKTFEDNSIDSCACDPPYALTSITKRFGKENSVPAQHGSDGRFTRLGRGFMNATWDNESTVHNPDFWSEVLRVLKPGGHLVAFAGSRTYHRMACAIEDAGFELRDTIVELACSDQRMIQFLESLSPVHRDALLAALSESGDGGMLAWIYATGFPKSHDISKALDSLAFEQWLDQNVDLKLRYNGEMTIAEQSGPDAENEVYQKYRLLSRTARKKVRIAPRSDQSPHLGRPGDAAVAQGSRETRKFAETDGGIAATDLAKPWMGYGTTLKPAFEPIVLARKPLSEGTAAANVLMHRTGVMNIDACRVEGVGAEAGRTRHGGGIEGAATSYELPDSHGEIPAGRWPANVIHDGSDEIHESFARFDESSSSRSIYGFNDKGSASRFFFSAKADKTDRFGSRHPTVKPIELMRWLVRLVTPKGGTVLDPFAGSGTTGVAALAEGMSAILIERESEYYQDILERIEHYKGTAKHSVVVRNRNKTEKEGTLL
jgi:DNA modification methylase